MYELIVRHFLACVAQDAVGKETTVRIDINGEKVSIAIAVYGSSAKYGYVQCCISELSNHSTIADMESCLILQWIHHSSHEDASAGLLVHDHIHRGTDGPG